MTTVLMILRLSLLILACVCAVLTVLFSILAANGVDESGEFAGRLIATFLPLSSKPSDYKARGWFFRKAQWTSTAVFVLAMIAWGFVGSFG